MVEMKDDVIYRQMAIDALDKEYRCTDRSDDWDGLKTAMLIIENLPSAQPEPYLDSIVSEIENTISETKKSGRHHEIHIRTNGEMICYGLQLALEIIEEKRNEQTT